MNDIRAAALERRITRLCHFTPSRNLQHIAAGRVGVLCTAALEGGERSCYNATDLERLDQRRTHICCSVEYPNAWYFGRARQNERLFQDWVVLLIQPNYLWKDSALFCPRNAAASYGRYIASGFEGFSSMYRDVVVGTGNRRYIRGPAHTPACPTDQQAEVLIEDRVLLEDIIGVAVRDEDQARTERVRLKINGIDADQFEFVVAPHFFDKYVLSEAITSGNRPPETVFIPEGRRV